MKYSRHILAGIVLALTMVTLAKADQGFPLSGVWAIKAEFQHQDYRTIISDSSSFVLSEGQNDGKGLFILGDTGESGIISWEAGLQNPDQIGPLVITIASAVSDEDFNSWIENRENSEVDPTLFIPVSSWAGNSNNEGEKTWTNEQEVVARIFIRGCDDNVFRSYGDLQFDKNAITFVTWTDEQGDSFVKFHAVKSHLLTNEETWASIRSSCAFELLPSTPSIGTVTKLSAASLPIPPDQNTILGLVEGVVDRIRTLVFNGSLTEKDSLKLLNELNKTSVSALRAGKASTAFKRLDRFRSYVEQYTQKGMLDFTEADALISGADAIESFVNLLHNKLVPGLCQIEEPCQSTLFYVQNGADLPSPDGTRNNPFPTIVEALNQSAKQNSCGVEIRVGEGIYYGDLVITRKTRITGPVSDPPDAMIIAGSIVNTSPFSVQIENGTIAANADGILSDHPCARTITSNVNILGARGYGIYQQGGVLLANETTVAGTMSLPGFPSSGTGILMTYGSRGVFSDVALTNNQSSGLFLAGTGTQLNALDLSVIGTRVHPDFEDPDIGDPFGGIHVRDEAELHVYGFNIHNNWFYGVRVETGGQAVLTGSAVFIPGHGDVACRSDFRDPRDPYGLPRCVAGEVLVSGVADTLEISNGRISNTRGIDTIFPSRAETSGGHNVAVSSGGSLRLNSFISTRADLAGVVVADGGELDLHTGIVSECVAGAYILIPEYDLSRLVNRVHYIDNGERFTTAWVGRLPVPNPSPF